MAHFESCVHSPAQDGAARRLHRLCLLAAEDFPGAALLQLRRLLELDEGQRLPEGPAIVKYLADRVPRSKPAPAAGTMERHRLVEWLHFIGTERHKADSALSPPSMPEEVMAVGGERPLERCRSGSRG